MIYLNKLLPILLSPLVLAGLLVLVGVFTRQRRWPVAGVALLWLASTPLIADHLFRFIEGDAVRIDPHAVPEAEAIVILSGMVRYVEGDEGLVPEWGDASDRLFGGVELARLQRAPRLIFTGGILPWQRGKEGVEPEGTLLARFATGLGLDPGIMAVTPDVENTEAEARAIRDMFAEAGRDDAGAGDGGGPRIILVTSAFHMPRAQKLFERAGFVVTPYPVDFRIDASGREPTDYFPDARALRRTDIALRELLGRAFYAVKYLIV